MSLNRKDMAGLRPFTNQTAPRQGRMKGSRNKLGADFLYALQREFEQHGESAIRRVRVDDPTGFLKVIASVLPKELEITDSRLKDVPDEQLDAIVEYINGRLADSSGHGGGREGSSLN
jgi:hypothetical protein